MRRLDGPGCGRDGSPVCWTLRHAGAIPVRRSVHLPRHTIVSLHSPVNWGGLQSDNGTAAACMQTDRCRPPRHAIPAVAHGSGRSKRGSSSPWYQRRPVWAPAPDPAAHRWSVSIPVLLPPDRFRVLTIAPPPVLSIVQSRPRHTACERSPPLIMSPIEKATKVPEAPDARLGLTRACRRFFCRACTYIHT
ncbi:hypothetical protein BT67DRAFT_161331 [Trichocladium antarcticum]|uniref:Uncharacterized protein n=1 Tax=Trichocladium antarcticum TaxID=1450529 RepID=A0AAN6ZAH8_9PEZI|nr:hypothetical protein BT67DRAFT_161331 [Trichocladium antarcticum]